MPTKGVSLKKPNWLKTRPPAGDRYRHIKANLRSHGLHTVCEEARCPNLHECWGGGTATIMLLGGVCTRGCRFCAVTSGHPRGWLDPLEPWKVARVLEEWNLDYVVLTSVARDDLPDGGAAHFARTVHVIKQRIPRMLVEVLIPDFQGDREALREVVEARPDVIGHNVETVERLTPKVRDRRAHYEQSLQVLKAVKELDPTRYTKSSLMLGLGETEGEVLQTMKDLRAVGVDFLTLGQYLQPTKKHLPVERYLPPEEFERYRRMGEELGFLYVAAGPLVRSSYRAGEFFLRSLIRGRAQARERERKGGREAHGQEHKS